MRTSMHTIAARITVASAPAVLAAQHAMGEMPAHELGVDVAAQYVKPSGGTGFFSLMTPVDVRVGFIQRGGGTLEPRITLQFLSGGGAGVHDIGLDLNATLPAGGTYRHGAYLTFGAGAEAIGATACACRSWRFDSARSSESA